MILEQFNNMNFQNLKNNETPCFFQVTNLPSLETIIDSFINFNVECSKFGISTEVTNTIPLKKFLQFDDKNLYVFQDIYNNRKFYNVIRKLIPPICDKNIRISRLYIGEKSSGSHIHHHTFAINYLIYGTKLWVLFPETRKNTKFLEKHNIDYGSISGEIPLDWINKNRDLLLELDGVEFKLQDAGDVFTIPEGYYHGVYNLTRVCGITYSWN